ncbi:hypothetical protein ILYODFUR_015567 [Ilyodon furcidens]|uniref:Uncharacterized protein n=1 Tax=Ilyodon furcidens TaxID=33524 RepID=A0ABV0U8P4_9TELE
MSRSLRYLESAIALLAVCPSQPVLTSAPEPFTSLQPSTASEPSPVSTVVGSSATPKRSPAPGLCTTEPLTSHAEKLISKPRGTINTADLQTLHQMPVLNQPSIPAVHQNKPLMIHNYTVEEYQEVYHELVDKMLRYKNGCRQYSVHHGRRIKEKLWEWMNKATITTVDIHLQNVHSQSPSAELTSTCKTSTVSLHLQNLHSKSPSAELASTCKISSQFPSAELASTCKISTLVSIYRVNFYLQNLQSPSAEFTSTCKISSLHLQSLHLPAKSPVSICRVDTHLQNLHRSVSICRVDIHLQNLHISICRVNFYLQNLHRSVSICRVDIYLQNLQSPSAELASTCKISTSPHAEYPSTYQISTINAHLDVPLLTCTVNIRFDAENVFCILTLYLPPPAEIQPELILLYPSYRSHVLPPIPAAHATFTIQQLSYILSPSEPSVSLLLQTAAMSFPASTNLMQHILNSGGNLHHPVTWSFCVHLMNVAKLVHVQPPPTSSPC